MGGWDVPLDLISRSRASIDIKPMVSPLAKAAPQTQRIAIMRSIQLRVPWNKAKPAAFLPSCLLGRGGWMGGWVGELSKLKGRETEPA